MDNGPSFGVRLWDWLAAKPDNPPRRTGPGSIRDGRPGSLGFVKRFIGQGNQGKSRRVPAGRIEATPVADGHLIGQRRCWVTDSGGFHRMTNRSTTTYAPAMSVGGRIAAKSSPPYRARKSSGRLRASVNPATT